MTVATAYFSVMGSMGVDGLILQHYILWEGGSQSVERDSCLEVSVIKVIELGSPPEMRCN